MLRPSNVCPVTAFDVDATAVGLTAGVATPLCFLLLPCSSESLRLAGDASPRWLSGSITLLSGKAEVADDWSPDAPATLTSVAAAAATSDSANTTFQRRLERILSPSVDPGPGRSPSRAHFRWGPRYPHLSQPSRGTVCLFGRAARR